MEKISCFGGSSPNLKTSLLIGFMTLIVFVGGGFWWSATAPIDSAAVSQGSFVIQGNRRDVQHLEGGIVKEIRVKDGDVVKPGDILVVLDDVQDKARRDMVKSEYYAALAHEARLIAERDDLKDVVFPEDLEKAMSIRAVKEAISGQKTIFKSRRAGYNDQIGIIQQRETQLQAEVDSLKAQVASFIQQKKLIDEELRGVDELFKKGLTTKSRLLALQREATRLEGEVNEKRELISRSMRQIGEAKLQEVAVKNKRLDDVVAELRKVQEDLSGVREKLQSTEDKLVRDAIMATIGGTIVNMRVHTVGSVIEAGGTIANIVPKEDDLLVETRLNPQDIDVVRIGLPAKVRLTAYKARATPIIDGKVTYVSADSMVEQRTGQPYYVVRVAVTREAVRKAGDIQPSPGMPAEVMIVTGARTLLAYLTQPLNDSLSRAFRED